MKVYELPELIFLADLLTGYTMWVINHDSSH